MSHCWYWAGSYYDSGYGQAWSCSLQRGTQAHRLVYEELVGPIPEGRQLDHLCRVRGCVNPAHLRVVTSRENIMAPGSTCIAKAQAEKEACHRGHSFTPENTYLYNGRRHCRACKRAEKKARRIRNSAHGTIPTRAAGSPSGAEAVVNAGINATAHQDIARQDAMSVSN